LHYAKGCDFSGNDTSAFEDARQAAKQSDVVLICIGEKREWSGESGSRSSIALPEIQQKLVHELQKIGKPLVLIISSGRPVELVGMHEKAHAIIEIWQPGSAGGTALAHILSGKINPSAKLAITFPLTTGQQPMYYNRRESARPIYGQYRDIPKEPLYEFGHGLSYTTYSYDSIKLSSSKIRKNEKLIAKIEITNTGKYEGKETVLWFISDPVANISRPVKELKYVEKKNLKAGEKTTYICEIDPMRDLSYPDNMGKRHLETGDYYLLVGNQKVKFELTE
jgi:beta-glucosidase